MTFEYQNPLLNQRPQRLWRNMIFCGVLILGCVRSPLFAEDTLRAPPVWWFGLAGGVNLNLYWGTTQQLNPGFTTPTAFHKGLGAGLYLAPLIEYRPDPKWGGILQVGYDDRRGSFYGVTCPCGQNATLSAKPAYISIEPSLRFAPFANDFYLFAGPRIAFSTSLIVDPKGFTYTQEGIPDTKADFSSMRSTVYSGQFGAGYEMDIAPSKAKTRVHLAPFLSYQPHYGQALRTTENWTLSTLRVGVALKFGRGKILPAKADTIIPVKIPEVEFSVQGPKTMVAKRRIRETLPLRNSVFFEEGSTEIPSRYAILTRDQAASFKEEQLQDVQSKNSKGRSLRQMAVYYNILNTLGDRMRRSPGTRITLSGASSLGSKHGKVRAETVKRYLTDVFGIAESRIATEGHAKPVLPSEQPGGTRELDLLKPEDQRVDITSHSPEMLVQIGEGSRYELKPMHLIGVMDDSLDNVVLNVVGAEEALNSWSVEITDEQGAKQVFGPYTRSREILSGNAILGDSAKGDFKIVLVGSAKDGTITRKEASLQLVRREEIVKEALRFSILFEFDQPQPISSYEKFLVGTVAPLIPDSSKVVIRGHTDLVGEEEHNRTLSKGRAVGAQGILEQAVSNSGKGGVVFDTQWYGEDVQQAPFENAFPEERFYNRTVIIDIIPN